MSHDHAAMLPRGTIAMTGALILFAIGATAAVRLTGTPLVASPTAMRAERNVAPVATRTLRFSDRADGAVVIEDVDAGSIAQVIEPGQQTGFIRGVMRGMARDRRMHGVGEGPPFSLTLWRDGELSLTDTATGRAIELTAFGSSNRAAFAALLPQERRP